MTKRLIIYKTLFPFVILASICSCNNGNDQTSHEPHNLPNMENDTLHPSPRAYNTARGMEVFQQRCIACHGLNGNYRNNNAADLSVSRADSITIINTIKNGRGAMPLFGTAIPDSDLAQVELYVKTLRK